MHRLGPAGVRNANPAPPLARRAHLKRLLPVSLTLLVTSLLPMVAIPAAGLAKDGVSTLPQPRGRRIGVWMTNSPSPLYYDSKRIDAAVAELAATGFNTIYPNVWSRGATFHRSRYAPLEPTLAAVNPNLDPICRITKAAQRHGMQVLPWFEYGLMEPGDAEVVRLNPDWVLRRADGSALYAMHGADLRTSPLKDLRVWLNPAHPGVRQRFIGLIMEIVQRCGVDGIQLDDHFAWPVDLGYDNYTRMLYRQTTGREPPANPKDRYWMRWRRYHLTSLMRELRIRLQQTSTSKRLLVSLSPGPYRSAFNEWLQDWELWAMGGLVDDLVVQNYAFSMEGFTNDLNQAALIKARSWGVPVEIGVLAGLGARTTDMDTIAEKVQLAASRGHGVIYFFWEGLWGKYAGSEGAAFRQSQFNSLHRAAFGTTNSWPEGNWPSTLEPRRLPPSPPPAVGLGRALPPPPPPPLPAE
jgi:uncharacterized lipoprotein YddW (UPF0748 family)